MATHPTVPPPPPFGIYSSLYDAATRWPAWIRSFRLYLAASGVTDDGQQRGLLQYLGGDDLQQFVQQLSATGTTLDDMDKAIQDDLGKHQNPTLRYQFRQLRQQTTETMEAFASRLRVAAQRSGFPDVAAQKLAVLDQIITGCKSDAMRRKLLEIDTLDADKALKAARAYEASLQHTLAISDTQTASGFSQPEVLAHTTRTAQPFRLAQVHAHSSLELHHFHVHRFTLLVGLPMHKYRYMLLAHNLTL